MGMTKGAKKRVGSRTSGSSKSSKKLEALRRAQKIDEILLFGNVQSQAASDSAVEERPAGESHIVDLLENRKMAGRNVFERPAPARKRRPQRKAKKPAARKSKPKKRKGSKRKR